MIMIGERIKTLEGRVDDLQATFDARVRAGIEKFIAAVALEPEAEAPAAPAPLAPEAPAAPAAEEAAPAQAPVEAPAPEAAPQEVTPSKEN